MAVDGCAHSFHDLSTKVLPKHMRDMKKAMENPTPMNTFLTGTLDQCRTALHQDRDFSGCYVLIEKKKPIYAGISRKVISRLRQHVKGKTHFDASLAYRIAKHAHPHTKHREKAMDHAPFLEQFRMAQERIRKMSVAVVKIDCPVELYAFELYCAMQLDTGLWNSFKTH
jgi:predicted GIY-YIG superfamily endonuclease